MSANDCQHEHEITDTRTGDVICSSCGLVLDLYYVNGFESNENFYDKVLTVHKFTSIYDYLCEMLERLNISKCYMTQISDLYTKRYKFYSTENRYILLAYCCYQILNENNVAVSIKNISAVTGFSIEKISQMQETTCLNFDVESALEKYCNMLNLSFHDFSLIKENFLILQLSGHNPLTLISAAIYRYCLKTGVQKSLKDICEVTGISKISVQRYMRTTK